MRVGQLDGLQVTEFYWRGVSIKVEGFGYMSTNIPEVVDQSINFVKKGKSVTIEQECRKHSLEKPRIVLRKVWNREKERNEVMLNLLDTCVVDCQDLFKILVVDLINEGFPVVVSQFTNSPPQESFMIDHSAEYQDKEPPNDWEDAKSNELTAVMLIDNAVLESITLQTGTEAIVEDRKFKRGILRRAKYRPCVVFQH